MRTTFFLFALLLCSACQETHRSDTLLIATAANMQFAMKEIVKSFTEQSGIPCEIIISSSGKLTAQIKEGAPFDVLVSANMKYPEDLHQDGFTTNAPQIYAYGQLVLWTIDDGLNPSVDSLVVASIDHIALANPKNAPYGMAAMEVLEKQGIYQELKEKLVFGESIAQTNQFIISKAAEMGFTAKSVVLSPEMRSKGHFTAIDPNWHQPIAQGIVLLKKSDKLEQAQQFYNYLFSDAGQTILNQYGYSTTNI